MARNRVILETITCDKCGQQIDTAIGRRIAVDKDTWELDLCATDAAVFDRAVGEWVIGARKAVSESRRPAPQAKDEWKYLDSLGFTRHRGRKTAAAKEALSAR